MDTTSVKYFMIEIITAKIIKMASSIIIKTAISSSRCKVLVKEHIAIEVHKMTITILEEEAQQAATITDTTIAKTVKVPIIINITEVMTSNPIQMVEAKEMIMIATTTITEIIIIITEVVIILRTIKTRIMATAITTREVVKTSTIIITTIMLIMIARTKTLTTTRPLEVKSSSTSSSIITGRTKTMINSPPLQAKDRNIEDDFSKSSLIDLFTISVTIKQ